MQFVPQAMGNLEVEIAALFSFSIPIKAGSFSNQCWFGFPISRSRAITRCPDLPIPPIPSEHHLWYSHKFFAGM